MTKSNLKERILTDDEVRDLGIVGTNLVARVLASSLESDLHFHVGLAGALNLYILSKGMTPWEHGQLLNDLSDEITSLVSKRFHDYMRERN